MNNNNMNNMNNMNNNRKFGNDRTNLPRQGQPQPTTSNAYNLNRLPPGPNPAANGGNEEVDDSMAGQRARAQRAAGNPMLPSVTPKVNGSGRSVAPPNDADLYVVHSGPFPCNLLWSASVFTTVGSNSIRTVSASLGGIPHWFKWSNGNTLRDRELLGQMTYLGANGNISTPALQLWLLFHSLKVTFANDDLRGTFLHLCCDESTHGAFKAEAGQDLDFDLCSVKAKEYCQQKGITFAVSKTKAPVDSRKFSKMEKELAQAKPFEKKITDIKGKCTSLAVALKAAETENRRLREEMGRHGNALSMLSLQSQPKRKNQDSDPDQSIRSSKSVRH